jgi:hypothetical protein
MADAPEKIALTMRNLQIRKLSSGIVVVAWVAAAAMQALAERDSPRINTDKTGRVWKPSGGRDVRRVDEVDIVLTVVICGS